MRNLKTIDRQIQRVREQLAALGPMRPGTLTRQYRQRRAKKGAFWQLSYTHQMKSRSEYVRPGEVTEIRREIAAFRRFKKLSAQWVELALRRSQLRLQLARTRSNLAPPSPAKRPQSIFPALNSTNIPTTS